MSGESMETVREAEKAPVKKCPECGAEVMEGERNCHQCGYPLQSDTPPAVPAKPAKSKKRIVLIAAAACAVLLVILVCIMLPVSHSRKAFETAQTCEKEGSYEDALNNYERVISRDAANYEVASQKINEMKKAINVNKLAARAVAALCNRNMATGYSSLSDLKVGTTTVTCRIAGVGYVISMGASSGGGLLEYTQTVTDAATNMTITVYKADFMYNGWLTSITNDIMQQTSDTLFQSEVLGTKSDYISENAVQKYVKAYQESRDASVFTGQST